MKKLFISILFLSITITGCDFLIRPSAHWKFDKGSGDTAIDSAKNGNDGTIISNAGWVNGKVGDYALNFDGENSYVEVPYNNDIFNSRVFTAAQWLYSSNGTGNAAFLRRVGGWHLSISNGGIGINFENECSVQSGYILPDNEWHHVAVTVNNRDREVTFYVDGEKFGETQQYETAFSRSDGSLLIGSFSQGYRWKGIIDDVRFYKRAIKADVIQDLFEMGNDKVFTPMPAVSPDAGTYSHDVQVTMDCPETGADIFYTLDGTDPTTASQKYTEPVVLTEKATTTIRAIALKDGMEASYPSTVVYTIIGDENLLAHWRLDEGSDTIIADSTGNGNEGLFLGLYPEWIQGKVGNFALALDGTGDYIEVPYRNEIFNAPVFTAAMWLYSDNGSDTCAYFRRVGGWHLMTKSGVWTLRVEGGSIINSSHTFPEREWHHYAMVVNNELKTVSFYVDGELISGPVTYKYGFDRSNGDIYIGQFSSSFRWKGMIDDIRFYNKELDGQEIMDLVIPGN